MRKNKKPGYLTYGSRARKAKKKLENKRCTRCKATFGVNGFSPYPNLCKLCYNKISNGN